MQVNAVIEQQGQINVVYAVAKDLAHPIVLGKGGADDAKLLFALRKGNRKGKRKQAGHQNGNDSFHEYSPHQLVFWHNKAGHLLKKMQIPLIAGDSKGMLNHLQSHKTA